MTDRLTEILGILDENIGVAVPVGTAYANILGLNRAARAIMALDGWRDIATVPRLTYVDLWVVGSDDTVDFYCANASKVKGKPLRHGRTENWRLEGDGKWRSNHGLGYPLSPDVTPTHWMPRPPAPEQP